MKAQLVSKDEKYHVPKDDLCVLYVAMRMPSDGKLIPPGKLILHIASEKFESLAKQPYSVLAESC